MRLVSIRLKNIKSHRDTELTFSPGINVLSGPNGAGKSTIFEAIGYALFGVSAQDFVTKADRFLSIGAKKGEISVVFEPADGELYRVTRTVGPAAKWLLAKRQGDDFEIEEHANLQETETRIATLLGLNNGRSLADQFKLVIGPFQNDFLGPFVIKQPTARQNAFDQILGIDAWRRTYDGTKSIASAIQSRSEVLKAEIAGREEQVAALPERVQELKALKVGEQEKVGELSARQAEVAEVSARIAALDGEKGRLDAAQAEVQALEERIGSGKEHVASQQTLVEQSRAASVVLGSARAGKECFDRAEQELKELRTKEQAKLQLERKKGEIEKELSALCATRDAEAREVAELRQGIDADAVKLSREELALTEARGALQQEESAARRGLAATEAALAGFKSLPLLQIDTRLPYLLTALDRQAALAREAGDKERTVSGADAVRRAAAEAPALKRQLDEVQAGKARLLGQKQSLLEGKEKLSAGECPFFGEPCRNLETGGGADPFSDRIARLDREISQLEAKSADLAAALTAAERAANELVAIETTAADLAKLEAEKAQLEREFAERREQMAPKLILETLNAFLASTSLAQVPAGAVVLDLAGTPAERREQLETWGRKLKTLAAKVEADLNREQAAAREPVLAVERKKAGLDANGNELGRFRTELSARKERLAVREKAIAARDERVRELQETLQARLGELSRLEDVTAQIARTEGELERYRKDRDTFIANEAAAEQLAAHQERLERYQQRLLQLQQEREAKHGELESLKQSYDPARHDAAKGAREQLLGRMATLEAELAGLKENARRLEGEVEMLTAMAEEVRKKTAAIGKLARQGEMVKLLRNQVFKNVSAQLSERFREEISFRADRIYRSIAESDEELVWGENYQVVLRDMADGAVRERSDDQLSGGQMMSAVVALRLALLQTIGARIAFFDEPTSNLDAERRENLAKAFRAIDLGKEEVTEHWYDQLFLVSHDVSFTEITDQMIQLGGDQEQGHSSV
ncbi:AAA family ATPase [Geomesophilobacter sediminis]|uniref:SMC family ATPase n=1 Tax=Geomesophilobacter sediminis TaxID=2798584 RepID=A0A8J7M2H3_9BACT|nr:SMC family ATPase [Geomesophilobacter sediminis]MBJ6727538.1 SMC family ATPase [Geomesophilobacter sediminis]